MNMIDVSFVCMECASGEEVKMCGAVIYITKTEMENTGEYKAEHLKGRENINYYT